MASLALHLLGSPRVERDGATVEIHRRQALGLLAYLAVTGEPHNREALAALFWPESDDAHARADLRRILSALAKDLGGGVIAAGRGSVRIDPAAGLFVDVARFRGLLARTRGHGHPDAEPCGECLPLLEEAAGLYRGDFMAGASLRNSPEFDDWQFFQADGLRRDAAGALDRLVRGHAARGAHERALEAARRLLALDPAHEPAHRALMELYALTGRRAAALRQFAECERVLEREFGEKPSAESAALYERVRSGDLAHVGEPRPDAAAAPGPPAREAGPPATPAAPRLPAPTTPCLGREAELAEIAARLADPGCRLVTLVGPGGIGKTRLALEAAALFGDRFADGAAFVPLGCVASPDLLPPAVAGALGLAFDEPAEPLAALSCALAGRELLLVLDNFERLLDGAGVLVELLERAPRVKLLVTSRERMSVRGEWLLEVGGLPFPRRGPAPPGSGGAETYSAVQLFLLAARRARPGFAPPDGELGHVARICALVAGMPLGIELAAAWARVLSCEEIARELEAGLGFLETTLRDVPERHRSLRAVFESSWQLLSAGERRVFRALSGFRDGFRRDAAERVAGASLPTLSALTDKSLLRRDDDGRYELHGLLRQFAAEKLDEEPAERDRLHAAHADYYAALLARRGPALERDDAEAIREVAAEIENVRAAWWWAVDACRAEVLARMLEPTFRFYDFQGWLEEGKKAFAAAVDALGRGGDPLALGKALAREAAFCGHLGLYERARHRLERALPLLEAAGATAERALALNRLGVVLHQEADHERAWALLEESLALSRAAGDEAGLARSLGSMGYVAGELRRYEEAERLLEESLGLNRRTGRRKKVAAALNDLGYIVHLLGKNDRAERLLEESLAIRRELGHRKGIAITLGLLGWVAEANGDAARAGRCFREALERAAEIGATPVVLDVAVGLAKLMLARGEAAGARGVLEVAAAHPAGWDDTRRAAGEMLGAPAPRLEGKELRRALEGVVARLREPARHGAPG